VDLSARESDFDSESRAVGARLRALAPPRGVEPQTQPSAKMRGRRLEIAEQTWKVQFLREMCIKVELEVCVPLSFDALVMSIQELTRDVHECCSVLFATHICIHSAFAHTDSFVHAQARLK
jgi:hypothetical protein